MNDRQKEAVRGVYESQMKVLRSIEKQAEAQHEMAQEWLRRFGEVEDVAADAKAHLEEVKTEIENLQSLAAEDGIQLD